MRGFVKGRSCDLPIALMLAMRVKSNAGVLRTAAELQAVLDTPASSSRRRPFP
jgi:hypothetical protein